MVKENTKDRLKHTNYSIGLDIGTNSVGWAVVDENMNLVKRCKKHLWGSRLFEERSTAESRRKFRTARRRLLRRRVRLAMLNKIFEPFVADKNFFVRMHESFLQIGDRSQRNKDILFCDENSCLNPLTRSYIKNDADFYKAFPTIYHLRQALIENPDKEFDPRLIYLAVHHILKSRGNFINADLDTQNGEKIGHKEFLRQILGDICAILDEDFDEIEESSPNYWIKTLFDNADNFVEILDNTTLSKKDRQAKIKTTEAFKKSKEIEAMCNLLLGYKANLIELRVEGVIWRGGADRAESMQREGSDDAMDVI